MIATLRLDPARVRLLSGFVDTYLRLDARETTLFHEQLAVRPAEERKRIMEIVTSWQEEGRAEGRAEGMLAIVLAQLAKRCGPLPQALEARVRDLPPSSLQALGEALLDLETTRDVERWLAQRP